VSAKDLVIAIDRDDADELAIVLSFTTEGINDIYDGGTPLWHAVKREPINKQIITMLLEAGADPDGGSGMASEEPPVLFLYYGGCHELARELIKRGANTSSLSSDDIHDLIWGWEEIDSTNLHLEHGRQDYLASRHHFFGKTNPENLTDGYKVSLVRTNEIAYRARQFFDGHSSIELDELRYVEPPGCLSRAPITIFRTVVTKEESNHPWSDAALWCSHRYGRSLNILDDNTALLIGGEHEDYYDYDFRIYNDVTIITPDGQIEIYGYPFDVFPPTDFHTATRAGDWIYIIGAVGYKGTRPVEVSVYRLSLIDFHIEECQSSGEVPPQMCRHMARLVDGHRIQTKGGNWLMPYQDRPLDHIHELDIHTMEWRFIPVESSSKG